MDRVSPYSRGVHLVTTAVSVLGMTDWERSDGDPDGLRFIARTAVWARWVLAAFMLVLLAYRPVDWPESYAVYVPGFVLLVALNGYTHYRLATRKAVTRGWILAFGIWDVLMLSAAGAAGGGFSNDFLYLLYYVQLAALAVVLASFWLTMAGATVVAGLYLAISLTVADGIDTAAGEEEALFARIFVMYAVAAIVNIIARFERVRWRQAVERERHLQRERVELSQAIHDTTAQSAYMIGLGIDTARAQAGATNPELAATLEATSRLSRSAIWELRHPIHMGGIYEGSALSAALKSHASSFTNVTSVPCELTQTGVEPPLSTETRGLLFSIAHNALTNAYRHAEASKVAIHLASGKEEVRLSVLDDGVGLPADYAKRGRGFENMDVDARRLGGRLVVEQRGAMGGASVTCVIPQQAIPQ
ncbi:MAG: histidine kinase [Chloroflexi bacterium]|nr:histidine kinase [Chloroflexota bacterium]